MFSQKYTFTDTSITCGRHPGYDNGRRIQAICIRPVAIFAGLDAQRGNSSKPTPNTHTKVIHRRNKMSTEKQRFEEAFFSSCAKRWTNSLRASANCSAANGTRSTQPKAAAVVPTARCRRGLTTARCRRGLTTARCRRGLTTARCRRGLTTGSVLASRVSPKRRCNTLQRTTELRTTCT